ncbi:MAG: exodeoxyribonuclease I [Salinisphaera sp.]|nr:exodeoxyribonuclease I [Salinisphaera sp.]
MATTTLYWHDYETFGTNPRLDRPAQFAGLRTDLDLNPLGEPLVAWCRPPPDILPQPQACLITGITPQLAERNGLPEPEFIGRIHAQLSTPGTCSLGYNSMRFDDEVTRHTLWRNFFDPYRREWADGCSRWDIIDMVRLTHALRPQGITWPRREDGAPSFRLEDLAAANGLEQEQAHDALSDVRATIALARLVRERQPRLYHYVFSHRDKRSARALLDVGAGKPVLHVSARFPANQGCISLILPLAAHPEHPNEIIACDLRHDPAPLLELAAQDIRERLYTPAADLPDGMPRIPIKSVHVNKCPVLAPVSMLQPAEAERLQLDGATLRRHRDALASNIDEVRGKLEAVFGETNHQPNDDPEQGLYGGGFVSDQDRRRCERLRAASAEELADRPPAFEDTRLQAMLLRYRARNFPGSLDATEQNQWQQWRENRLQFAPDGGLTLEDYEQALEQLRSQPQTRPDQADILAALAQWGQTMRAACPTLAPAERPGFPAA